MRYIVMGVIIVACSIVSIVLSKRHDKQWSLLSDKEKLKLLARYRSTL